MKRPRFHTFAFVLAVVLTFSCTKTDIGKETIGPPAEEVFLRLHETGFNEQYDAKEMLKYLETAERSGQIEGWRADSMRARIMRHTFYSLDSAVVYSKRSLAYDSVRLVPQRYINELLFLASNLLTLGRPSEAIRYCLEGAPIVLVQKDVTARYAFDAITGTGLYWMKDKVRGRTYLEKSIAGLKSRHDKDGLWWLSYAMGQTMDCLQADDTDHALAVGRERENVLQELQEKAVTAEDSAQVDAARGLTFSKMAFMYARKQQPQEAARYEQLYYRTSFAHSTRGRQAILDYYDAAGMHEKLLDRYEESKDYWLHKDTICKRYAEVLGMRATCHAQRGEHTIAVGLRQRQMEVLDSVYTRENQNEGIRLAAIYQVQEKEAVLARKEIQTRFYLLFLGVAAVALAVTLFLLNLLHRRNKNILYKNRMLLSYINRLNERENEVEDIADRSSIPPTYGENEEGTAGGGDELDEEHLRRHVALLRRLINDEQMYLDADFSREKLQRRMKLSKNLLTPVLKAALQGKRLNDYISERRVRYACRVMQEDPGKSVSEIAAQSGFGTVRTFNRVFKEHTGMTATEYLKASL